MANPTEQEEVNPRASDDLVTAIRSKKRTYPRTEAAKAEPPAKKTRRDDEEEEEKEADSPPPPSTTTLHGAGSADVERRVVDFRGKLMLAPMATVGNMPFRRVCKGLGADITCGEMAFARQILHGHGPEWSLLRRHPSEDVFGIQIAGSNEWDMAAVAELAGDELSVDYIDVNAGCPLDLVCNMGAGAALLDRPNKLVSMVASMRRVTPLPILVKLRIGRAASKPVAHTLIPRLEAAGADGFIVHGRTRQQRYKKQADWGYIGQCAASTSLPLFGNGDVFDWTVDMKHWDSSAAAGLTVARGALMKPWLFTELKERRTWDISATERLDLYRDFVNYGGSDDRGVSTTRRFLLEWLSFAHRYVPVGLLERPQTLTSWTPDYTGRSDLETLLGSRHVEDWVKISALLLGPPGDGFVFTPKHKSQSSY